MPIKKIADDFGVSTRTVDGWLKVVREEAMPKALEARRKLAQDYLADLQAILDARLHPVQQGEDTQAYFKALDRVIKLTGLDRLEEVDDEATVTFADAAKRVAQDRIARKK